MKRLLSALSWPLLLAVSVAPVLTADDANAQRRIIGNDDDDDEDEDDVEDKKAAEEKERKAKAAEEARKKAEAEAARKEAEEEAAEAAREKAQEEAERKAEEAERKAEEEKKAKEEAKKAAEEKKLQESRAARLKAAKKQRRLLREAGKVRATLAMTPGHVEEGKLLEFTFDIAEKLEVASTKYGNLKPMNKLVLIATLKHEESGETTQHLVHPVGAPGRYGFHLRTQKAGIHMLTLEAHGSKLPVSVMFPIRSGEWPPADFDDEEKRLRDGLNQGAGSGRRVISGR